MSQNGSVDAEACKCNLPRRHWPVTCLHGAQEKMVCGKSNAAQLCNMFVVFAYLHVQPAKHASNSLSHVGQGQVCSFIFLQKVISYTGDGGQVL